MQYDGEDYRWTLRINRVLYGKENTVNFLFNSNVLCVHAIGSNKNGRLIAGYLGQMGLSPIGYSDVGNFHRIYDDKLKIVVLLPIEPFKLKFILGVPIGNCRLKIWEGLLL